MNKNRCKPHRKFSKELKEEILNKYYKDKIPFNVLSRDYKIARGTIMNWVDKTNRGLNVLIDRRTTNSGRRKDEATYKEKYEILKKMDEFVMQHREKNLFS